MSCALIERTRSWSVMTSSLTRAAARPASFQLRSIAISVRLAGLMDARRPGESDRGAGGAAVVWDDVRSRAEAVLAEGAPAWPFCVVGAGFAAGAAGDSEPLMGCG